MKITDYIKDFAISSVLNHEWQFKKFFNESYQSAINILVQHGPSNEYIIEVEKRRKAFQSVFEYYCLMAIDYTKDNMALRLHIRNCRDSINCGHTYSLFVALTNEILSRLSALNPNVSYQKISEITNGLDDIMIILLQEFIRRVAAAKAYDRIVYEFELVEEIEFTKRFKHYGTDSSD